jgi:hypothetical protein
VAVVGGGDLEADPGADRGGAGAVGDVGALEGEGAAVVGPDETDPAGVVPLLHHAGRLVAHRASVADGVKRRTTVVKVS